ncbi:MAG: nuclear transport factor 2 family protein [Bacteroidia bacterium]
MKIPRFVSMAVLTFALFCSCKNESKPASARNKVLESDAEIESSKIKPENQKQIDLALNSWHHAAATAKEDAFYNFMTNDCIYLGTDPSEKWYRDELREWAAFAFERDTAWAFYPFEREIYFAKNGQTAWFDEKLKTEKMGECRGSGVVIKTKEGWKLKHYNLSITILNEKMGEFLEIEQTAEKSNE